MFKNNFSNKSIIRLLLTILFLLLFVLSSCDKNNKSKKSSKSFDVRGTYVYESSSVKRELRVFGDKWWVKTTEKTSMGYEYESDKIDGGNIVNNKLYYDWNQLEAVGRIVDKNTINFDGRTFKKK